MFVDFHAAPPNDPKKLRGRITNPVFHSFRTWRIRPLNSNTGFLTVSQQNTDPFSRVVSECYGQIHEKDPGQ